MNLTRKDIEDLKEEIEFRKNERPKILEELKEARAQGDLSENFEYTMAKRANNQNNSRVRYLENIIRTATIITDTTGDDEVGLNKEVTVHSDDDGDETYKIVSSIRGNSMEHRISPESPLGKALMHRKVGETVTVVVNDTFSYDVTIRSIKPIEDDGTDGLRQY